MGDVGDRLGDADIIGPVGRRFAVGLERAVHHHRGEVGLDRRDARRRAVAVVEVHADRNLRIHFGQRVHHMPEHDVVGVRARAARGLDDDRRFEGVRRLADRQRLLHVVDVECRHAVAVFGGVIQQLTKCDTGHLCFLPDLISRAKLRRQAALCLPSTRGRRRRRSRRR